MSTSEIEAKSILRKHKKIDSWFISHYGMNLYRGCSHNCVYCDGRAEKYNVEGEFGKDVAVKVNAIDVLSRELDPKRKRVPLKKSYIMIGGGVGDSYQPLEKKYLLSRRTLELIEEHELPVHILTKSTLVLRDLDILKRINDNSRALVSFSFSSVNAEISALFEPGVPWPGERLKALAEFKKEGLACGIFLMPVIPFITDKPELIEEVVEKAKEVGIDFIIFGGMTLKQGRQEEYFFACLEKYYPGLIPHYKAIYPGSKWGEASGGYYSRIQQTFNRIMKKYRIPKRIPPELYKDILGENDLVIVTLEHIDYLLKLEGITSSYGYAAYSISKINESLSALKGDLQKIKGIGGKAEEIILEILETGSSSYYQGLLSG